MDLARFSSSRLAKGAPGAPPLRSDCGRCEECSGLATCADQAAGTDLKGDCPDTLFCNGTETCDGNGFCQGGTDPCVAPATCDEGPDVCTGCIGDADCPACQQCNSGTCVDQPAGTDVKNECGTDACVTGACDGAGACGVEGLGTDCGTCAQCDGAGICVDDLTQDSECGACEECGAGGMCVAQAAGADVKDECDGTNIC